MTKSIYRRALAVALLAALVIPFQNCGSDSDLGSYVNNSSTATAAPKIPEIVSSSSPGKVAIFQSTSLSVVAKGEGPLTYQWFKDGQPIANETNPILVIAEATGASPTTVTTTYLYKVVVSDKDGEQVEQQLPLIVERSPAQEAAIPTITSQTANFTRPTCAQNSNQGATIPISVTATGTRLTYAWKVTYLNATDNISGSTPTITAPVIPVVNANNQVVCRVLFFGTYNVVVTDAFGRTATTNIVVGANSF